MKILHLNLLYILPDDFSGDTNDAIEALLKHRREKGDNSETLVLDFSEEEATFLYNTKKFLWDKLMKLRVAADKMLVGFVDMSAWNAEAEIWERYGPKDLLPPSPTPDIEPPTTVQ